MRLFTLLIFVVWCVCPGHLLGQVHVDTLGSKSVKAAAERVKQAGDALSHNLGALKKPSVSMNVSVEEALRYQPASASPLVLNPATGWVNNVYLRGTVRAFGIPLNLNYSNDRSGFDQGGMGNNLFKFDFDPGQFKSMFQSDIRQYYDLRKTAFGGLDMGSYAKKLVQENLKQQEAKLRSNTLTKYLDDPAKITALLSLNEEQIKQKLTAIAKTEGQKQFKAKETALKELASNKELQEYLQDPAKLKELRGMDKVQVKQRLIAISKAKTTPEKETIYPELVPGINTTGLMKNSIAEHDQAQDAALSDIAGQVTKSKTEVTDAQSEVNTVAKTITDMKANLQKQGVDVTKMLQVQKLMDQNGGMLPATENAAKLLYAKPSNGLQELFTKVQALKIGAFGSQVPGNTQGQDMFQQGSSVTFKLGTTPITAGYAASNDITAGKDANYQSSVYSSPKNITYLGATMNRGVFGKVKIAVASSFGTGVNNNTYSASSSASDNVAVTMSKEMDMGKLGNVTLDVSKSTTLYNNNYQVGSDLLLARTSGVTLNPNNDLFEAVGFGLTHHLDIQDIGFTDNLYYNYAGLGYQNPGNNGSGGARMKLGGNVRKSFYKNKLIVNLRSDLRNTPISYTTNDQWRNYQVAIDSRYAVTKKFNLSLKYTANGTGKQVDNEITPVYSFQKLQVDGNMSYKIGKNFSVSHFSIGKQDFTNSYVSASGGSMILLNYTQSMVINKNTLTANILYNKELSALQLLGNLLNTDLSYSYTFWQKVSLSSGLTFLNNTGIASQAGIRQSVQLMANEHFDMGTSIDLRKNLVTPLYPDLYSACRAELSIRYHLKN